MPEPHDEAPLAIPAQPSRPGERAVAAPPPSGASHEAAEYALLGLLRDGPGHGYRLAAAFRPTGRLGLILRLKMSQMYAYLHKLERQRWLVVTDESAEATTTRQPRHMRRVFTLTPAGERAFDSWLTTPVTATREVRLTFLLKIAFAIHDRALALELLARQRETSATWLNRLRVREAQLRARSSGGDDDTLVGLLTLRQRIQLSEASLAWLDETANALQS